MTNTKRAVVIQAIAETQRQLAREMRYSPDMRDGKLISFYKKHLTKLTEMLSAA